jgi:hypothetical protein
MPLFLREQLTFFTIFLDAVSLLRAVPHLEGTNASDRWLLLIKKHPACGVKGEGAFQDMRCLRRRCRALSFANGLAMLATVLYQACQVMAGAGNRQF